jgi:murein DD-endopeptidase MepM/ murein hydrolase activator NlpD
MIALLLAAALAAAAPPDLALVPPAARPGDAVLVRVASARGAPPPAGAIAGRPLVFWSRGDEAWALAALPIETPPGQIAVEVTPAGGAARRADLDVVEPGFPSRAITVAPKYVEPPPSVKRRLEADRRAFAAAYDRPFAPPLFSKPFDWPRPANTRGGFGDKRVFNDTKASVHYGLDLAGARGAPVRAANDGVVVLARDAWLSGKSLVLWHGADVFTVYFHLDRIAVRSGARVKRGQLVGRVGSTGRSTGPHLHWSARVAGLYVDPESLLGIDFAAGTAPPRLARAPVPAAAPPPAEAPAPAAEAHAGPAADPATTAPPR